MVLGRISMIRKPAVSKQQWERITLNKKKPLAEAGSGSGSHPPPGGCEGKEKRAGQENRTNSNI